MKISPSGPGARCWALLSAVGLVYGCASESSVRRYVPQIVTPYRIEIQQGNFVTQDMVDKLAVGQTRDQVRFILGTPLLADIFHVNRWDYVFRLSRGWNDPEKRRLVVTFDANGRLERWDADVPPPPATPGAPQAPPQAASPAVPAEAARTTPEGPAQTVEGVGNLRTDSPAGGTPLPAVAAPAAPAR